LKKLLVVIYVTVLEKAKRDLQTMKLWRLKKKKKKVYVNEFDVNSFWSKKLLP
jgi:hypothetical protein